MTRKHLLLPALLILAIAVVLMVRRAADPIVGKTGAHDHSAPSLTVAPANPSAGAEPEAPGKAIPAFGTEAVKDKDELLSQAYDQLDARLSAARLQIGNKLASLNPAQRLAYLQSLMALAAP